MKAYRIVEWKVRYEVTDKGKPAAAETPMESLRKSPLPWIRWKNYGHRLGPAYRKLLKKAWLAGLGMEGATFGLFGKLIELAGDQQREFRGWILDEKQKPIDPEQIAELLGWNDVDVVRTALKILTDPGIGWVELVEFPEIPEIPGKKGSFVGEKGGALGGKEGGASEGSFLIGTETEDIINTNEIESSTKKVESASASHFAHASSASASSGQVFLKRDQAAKELAIIIRPRNQSDGTTIKNILDQLERRIIDGTCTLEIFDAAIDAAKECRTARKPIAMFIEAMKEPRFGYVPVRKKLLAGWKR